MNDTDDEGGQPGWEPGRTGWDRERAGWDPGHPEGSSPTPPWAAEPGPTAAQSRSALLLAITLLVVAAVVVGTVVGYIVRGPGSVTISPVPETTVPTSAPSAQALAIAAKVDPALVDVDTKLGYQDETGAGTGMVIGSSGLVLTNNHVIDGATSIEVTDIGNGKTYTATVVGYDISGDVAVLKLQRASRLATVPVGSSSALQVGDQVVAAGNAGGTGGTPSVVGGKVTALDQSITAADEANGVSEELTGLIETDAAIEAGDSGGPLIDTSGKVVGMDTAASSGYLFGGGSTEGFAIPIDTAHAVAKEIVAGTASATVHIGPTAFLGVEVTAIPPRFGGAGGVSITGAVVVGVDAGTPAARAGLVAGDVIESLNGRSVETPTALTTLLQALRPGDTVELGWQDTSGQSHSTSVTLASGPPA